MAVEKYNAIIKKLEEEELENGTLSAEGYAHLFAAYLLQNDFINANFLWKRIPTPSNVELERLHQLNVALQQNKPDAFKLIQYDWSKDIKQMIDELEIKIRGDVFDLIGNSYTYIYEDKLQEITNLPLDILLDACRSLGWPIEDANGGKKLILPKAKIVEKPNTTTSEEQLFILTDFVSFLEN